MVGSEAQARSKLRPGGFNLDGLIQHRVYIANAVTCSVKRSLPRPASIQCALLLRSETNIAIPAD